MVNDGVPVNNNPDNRESGSIVSWLFSRFTPRAGGDESAIVVSDGHNGEARQGGDESAVVVSDGETMLERVEEHCWDEAKIAFKETCNLKAMRAYFKGKKDPAGEEESIHASSNLKLRHNSWMASHRFHCAKLTVH
jgi:hypothetical protein